MSVSTSASQLRALQPNILLVLFLVGVVLHFIFLSVNTVLTAPLGLGLAERKTVVILSSQKTLPVAITVISFLDSSSWHLGIVVIPCIVCHFTQLLVDGFLADIWQMRTDEGGPLGLGLVSPETRLKLASQTTRRSLFETS
jgi:sodium/bile acid cotransporter 7